MPNTCGVRTPDRHLILIDIENIAGTSAPTEQQVCAARKMLAQVLLGFDAAQRIWACSHHAALAVSWAAPTDRHLWRSGHNGADLALVEVLNTERIGERFGHVTICSGDGIFAECAARLAREGVAVNVVAQRGHLSTRLRLAAHRHVFIPETASALGTAS